MSLQQRKNFAKILWMLIVSSIFFVFRVLFHNKYIIIFDSFCQPANDISNVPYATETRDRQNVLADKSFKHTLQRKKLSPSMFFCQIFTLDDRTSNDHRAATLKANYNQISSTAGYRVGRCDGGISAF